MAGQVMAGSAVRPLRDIGIGDRPLAGGKGASLGELLRAGFPVPDGFVVTAPVCADLLARLGPQPQAEAPAQAGPGLRARIETAPLPAGLPAAIAAHYCALGGASQGRPPPGRPGAAAGPPVAVRSSATAEDSAAASFAGTAESYLWVRGADAVAEHVRKCWASLYRAELVSYRQHLGLPAAGLAMAVVVQRMVDARCSGVMFTRSPATGDRSVIAVEAGWGLGSAVVGGEVTPDSFLVSKVTGEIVRRQVAVKTRQHLPAPDGPGVAAADVPPDQQRQPCLSDAEVRALARLGRRIEDHYGAAQDIEWAIARDSVPGTGLFLLQSRPETVWTQRPAQPLATAQATPFGHVLDLLSKNQPT